MQAKEFSFECERDYEDDSKAQKVRNTIYKKEP